MNGIFGFDGTSNIGKIRYGKKKMAEFENENNKMKAEADQSAFSQSKAEVNHF